MPIVGARGVDKSKFIVRDSLYAQSQDYPQFCATVTEQLLEKKPKTAHDMATFIAHHICKSYPFPEGTKKNRKFGKFRNMEWRAPGAHYEKVPFTPLDSCIRTNNRIRREQRLGPQRKMHSVIYHDFVEPGSMEDPSDRQYTIALSQVLDDYTPDVRRYLKRQGIDPDHTISIFHTSQRNRTAYDADLLWSQIEQHYMRALDGRHEPSTREYSAWMCYGLLSHYMPLERGSATLARIALEFLAHEAGFEVPYAKRFYDINIEALLTPPDSFAHTCMSKNARFWDHDVTSNQILAWHHRQVNKHHKLQSTPLAGR